MTTTITRAPATERVLGTIAWAIAALGSVKFAGLMVLHGPAQAPWGFLLVLVLPFVVGAALLRFRPRAGAALLGVAAAALAAVCAVALVQGVEPNWVDWLLVLVAGPLSVIAVGLSVRLLRGR